MQSMAVKSGKFIPKLRGNKSTVRLVPSKYSKKKKKKFPIKISQ